jgi:hypothetical protein
MSMVDVEVKGGVQVQVQVNVKVRVKVKVEIEVSVKVDGQLATLRWKGAKLGTWLVSGCSSERESR